MAKSIFSALITAQAKGSKKNCQSDEEANPDSVLTTTGEKHNAKSQRQAATGRDTVII
jgi:hypothetical protein